MFLVPRLRVWDAPLDAHGKADKQQYLRIHIRSYAVCLGCWRCMFSISQELLSVVFRWQAVEGMCVCANVVHCNILGHLKKLCISLFDILSNLFHAYVLRYQSGCHGWSQKINRVGYPRSERQWHYVSRLNQHCDAFLTKDQHKPSQGVRI